MAGFEAIELKFIEWLQGLWRGIRLFLLGSVIFTVIPVLSAWFPDLVGYLPIKFFLISTLMWPLLLPVFLMIRFTRYYRGAGFSIVQDNRIVVSDPLGSIKHEITSKTVKGFLRLYTGFLGGWLWLSLISKDSGDISRRLEYIASNSEDIRETLDILGQFLIGIGISRINLTTMAILMLLLFAYIMISGSAKLIESGYESLLSKNRLANLRAIFALHYQFLQVLYDQRITILKILVGSILSYWIIDQVISYIAFMVCSAQNSEFFGFLKCFMI